MNFAGKWKETENMSLSKVTQTQKDMHDRSLEWLSSERICQQMTETDADTASIGLSYSQYWYFKVTVRNIPNRVNSLIIG